MLHLHVLRLAATDNVGSLRSLSDRTYVRILGGGYGISTLREYVVNPLVALFSFIEILAEENTAGEVTKMQASPRLRRPET